MATAVGTSFDISKLGKELDKLDKQLDAIVKKGDKAKRAIEQMLLGDNANNFLNKIEKIKKSVIDLSSIKDPMKWDSAKLKGYIDQVNRLIRTVNQINTVNGGSKQLIDTTNLGDAKKELSSLLKEVKSLEKAQSERSTSRNQTYSGALKYSSNVKNLEQERQAIVNLEAARDKLKKTDSDYANKLNTLNEAIQRHERNLKDSAKTDQQRAAEAKKASDKIIEAQRREREEYEKRKKYTMDKWYSSNSERALKFSSNAKTLEDESRAIKYLEAARAKLNTQDKNYERNLATLNSRIREHKKHLDDAKSGAQELQDKHKGLMNTGEQLKRALVGVFSVSAIKGYVSKLVEVRGEFELQHRALQVLVGDVSEANRLWDKTVQLAVKSPFAVKELVTYTKQLAAYRV
jgi:chromosome segregation ATPase